MKSFKTIYFIYNADGGILNEVKYWLNKNIIKKESACELCDISHGRFFVRLEWLEFLKQLRKEHKVKVLHRNELPIKILERNFQLPCVLGETDEELIEIINKTSLRDLENLSNLKELRKKFFEKIL
tara:strand:- start:106 stop:483 length:378 start_codon:yes stop_codon:yes gene_type:complete